MSYLSLADKRPTLSQVARAIENHPGCAGVTRDEVQRACKERGVRIRNGRVPDYHIAAIYFGVQALRENDY